MLEHYLAIVLAGVLTVVAQLLLKKGAIVGRQRSVAGGFFNRYVFVGYGLMGVMTLASLYALKGIPLTTMVVVYPMIQMAVVFLSMVYFGEIIVRKQMLGIGLIIIGTVLFSAEVSIT